MAAVASNHGLPALLQSPLNLRKASEANRASTAPSVPFPPGVAATTAPAAAATAARAAALPQTRAATARKAAEGAPALVAEVARLLGDLAGERGASRRCLSHDFERAVEEEVRRLAECFYRESGDADTVRNWHRAEHSLAMSLVQGSCIFQWLLKPLQQLSEALLDFSDEQNTGAQELDGGAGAGAEVEESKAGGGEGEGEGEGERGVDEAQSTKKTPEEGAKIDGTENVSEREDRVVSEREDRVEELLTPRMQRCNSWGGLQRRKSGVLLDQDPKAPSSPSFSALLSSSFSPSVSVAAAAGAAAAAAAAPAPNLVSSSSSSSTGSAPSSTSSSSSSSTFSAAASSSSVAPAVAAPIAGAEEGGEAGVGDGGLDGGGESQTAVEEPPARTLVDLFPARSSQVRLWADQARQRRDARRAGREKFAELPHLFEASDSGSDSDSDSD